VGAASVATACRWGTPAGRATEPTGVTHGGNTESQISYTTLLRPRAGHNYEAIVTYDAGFYDVEIREVGPNGATGRKIEHRSLSECHRA
jgi:hypothetical protein